MIKIFKIEWDEDLGEGWMNIFNLELCLFSKEHTKKELITVTELKQPEPGWQWEHELEQRESASHHSKEQPEPEYCEDKKHSHCGIDKYCRDCEKLIKPQEPEKTIDTFNKVVKDAYNTTFAQEPEYCECVKYKPGDTIAVDNYLRCLVCHKAVRLDTPQPEQESSKEERSEPLEEIDEDFHFMPDKTACMSILKDKINQIIRRLKEGGK